MCGWKIISFGYTSEPLLADAKTVTRRDWKDGYAQQFKKDMEVAAYDKSPRNGGKQIATIRLTTDPAKEHMSAMSVSDFEAEGFGWIDSRSDRKERSKALANLLGVRFEDVMFPAVEVFTKWQLQDCEMWVIRFELLEVIE